MLESDKLQELAKDSINPEQKLHALETELNGLQILVCYLLETNERLRIQFRLLEKGPEAGSCVC